MGPRPNNSKKGGFGSLGVYEEEKPSLNHFSLGSGLGGALGEEVKRRTLGELGDQISGRGASLEVFKR